MNCFYKIAISSQEEFSYKSNLAFLIRCSHMTENDKLLAENIIQSDCETENYSTVTNEIRKICKREACIKNTAYIIAGNIGSGKTTLIHALFHNGLIKDGTPIVLEDIYKKIFFDSVSNLKKAYNYAKTFVGEQIKRAIINGDSFILELVPSADEKIDLIRALKEIGYKIVIYYLETDDVSINKYRVLQRFNEGGDFVCEDKVLSRKKLTLKYYPYLVPLSDELYFLNSSFNEIKLVHYIKNGKIIQITAN